MNRDVYDAVARRAALRCECGCDHRFGPFLVEQPTLDHAFGRANVKESDASCWMLRRDCHNSKTNNRPSAAVWLAKFIKHCDKYGYVAEKYLALNKIAVLKAKGMA